MCSIPSQPSLVVTDRDHSMTPRRQSQDPWPAGGAALVLAVAAVRHGRSPARLAARGRTSGISAFTEHFESLERDTQEQVIQEAAGLEAAGITALLIGSKSYPAPLSQIPGAPPVLFCAGSTELLTHPSIGICGSRAASDEGLRAATACGEVAAELDVTVISGYARGVDMATHVAALRRGGRTVIVLPEGIKRFRVKRGDFSDLWDPRRILVVSQFSPTQPWAASAAMARNSVILGLGMALIVVEAGEKGGTLNAGMRALEVNRPVVALEFSEVPSGNAFLLRRGAIPARSRSELSAKLKALIEQLDGSNQLSFF
jgi:DNA processing protein